MGRERHFREKCVTSLLYDPLISYGRSGSRCPPVVPVLSRPNQAHQRTDRILWAYTVPSLQRHTRTLSRGPTQSAVQQLL